MEKVLFKAAIAKDAPEIASVTKKAFAYYAGLAGLDTIEALSEDIETVKKDISDKLVYIAVSEGKIIGSLRIKINEKEKTAYLSRFGLLAPYRGNGVGKKFLEFVDAKMKCAGVKRLLLHTSSKISSIMIFYYSNGFYADGVSHDMGYPRALLIKEYIY